MGLLAAALVVIALVTAGAVVNLPVPGLLFAFAFAAGYGEWRRQRSDLVRDAEARAEMRLRRWGKS